MKKRIKWLASVVVLMTFACTSCAGVKVPVKTASDVRNLKVEDGYQYKYKVTFRDGTSQKFDDDQVDTKGGLVGVRGKNERDFRYYDSSDIVSVERKRKTHWVRGAAIGAGAGAAVLGGLTAGLAINAKNNPDPDTDLDGFGKPGVIALMAAGAAVVGGLIGMGIGGGIGGSIPKKKKESSVKVNVSPKVYTTQKMKVHGAGVGISGSF